MVEIIVKEKQIVEYRKPPLNWEYEELLDDSVIKNHLKIMNVVRNVLNDTEKSRNDDNYLVIEVLYRMDLVDVTDRKDKRKNVIIDPNQFKYFPSFETITRCRRKLNEQGLFLPTNPKVIEMRENKEKTLRKWFVEEKVNEK